MLLTIYNLPSSTRYSDVKNLIMAKCGPTEVILDNLVPHRENGSKKVTVGLAEEEDAAILFRKLNGLLVDGNQLIVESVKKKQTTAQNDLYKMTPSQLAQQNMHSGKPAPLMALPSGPQQPALQQPYYQQTKYQPSYPLGFSNSSQTAPAVTPSPFGGLYGTTQNTNYGYPQQLYQQNQQQSQSISGFDQRAPLGFSNQGSTPSVWSKQNDWNLASNASGGNQNSQQARSGATTTTRWGSPDDRRPARHDPPRDHGRDRSRRSGRDEPRDRRDEPRRDFRRDGPSHDRGRDAQRENRRGASFRDRNRDASARDRGRDHPRGAPARDPPRNRPRDEPSRRPEPGRGPKRQYSPPRPQQSGRVTRATARQQPASQQPSPWMKPQPNKTNAQPDYMPPSKRPKPGLGYVKPFDNQKADFQNKNNVGIVPPKPQVAFQAAIPASTKKYPKNAPARLELRSATWRNQLTSFFAKQILSNPPHKTDLDETLLLSGLKRAIRQRMETLFGKDLKITCDEMTTIYKQKYDDAEVFQEVVDHITNHGFYVVDSPDKAKPFSKLLPTTDKPAPQMKKEEVQQPVKTELKTEETVKILPSYPQGDKRQNKVHKRNTLEMFMNEQIILSRLDEATLNALNTEMDELCALIPEELSEVPPPAHQTYHDVAKTAVVDDLKRILKLNFARRKLNEGPILLRIFNAPKVITRSKLAPVLAELGITSLRKSPKNKPMYIGSCETYEVHDKLCAMDHIIVEGSTVTFKPLQLTGNQRKIQKEMQKAERNKFQDVGENEELNEGDDIEGAGEGDENCEEETQQNIDEETSNVNQGNDTTNADDETYENGDLEANESQENENNDTGNKETETNASTQEDQVTSNIESTDGNNETIVTQENTAKLDTLPTYMQPTENTGQINELPPVENEDFTADVDIDADSENVGQGSFKIDAEGDMEDKELSDLNAEDLEDFKAKINYEEIDMADLNEDDLEDW
ncbi:uncharacterized protein LOC124642920 [Helicoverpa zea]|uniref:uncharacterized protein LOC124642920 n=1 Tax=Helicoverpa zea TaxID=7113 RepID=UPI001F565224|nr:uncharacterized protein LOC124642920 [Helicoverpa zea]